MVLNLRVDERMLHGQVVVSWLKYLGVDTVIVANDDAANNEIEKMSLKMASPKNIKCAVVGVEKAITTLKDPRAEAKKIMVLVKTIDDALAILQAGIETPSVVIGNYGNIVKPDVPNKKLVSKFVRFDEADLTVSRQIAGTAKERGIPYYIANTPSDSKMDLLNY